MSDLFDVEAARALLVKHDAPTRLIEHLELVSSVARLLTEQSIFSGSGLDDEFIIAGAMLHDFGKIWIPAELDAPGNLHEARGEAEALAAGVPAALARVCKTHAQWRTLEVSDEELVIALADHLWKGKRSPELEERVTRRVARRLGVDYWDVWGECDAAFEAASSEATSRLLSTM